MINVAVIGYGSAGRYFHCGLIRLVSELRLLGVASRSAETRSRIVAEQSCEAYESLDHVLRDDRVDLVVVASPHAVHAEQAIASLRAGKHVVVDKPMCLTLAEADAMIEAASRYNRLLTVFHNRRFDGDFLTLRKIIADGRLGRLHWLEMAWNRHGPPSRWRADASAGGGRLIDLGTHLLDQALLLFPQPLTAVHTRLARHWPGLDVDSHATVTLTFEGDATAILDVGSMTRYPKPRFLAVGHDATFVKFGIDPQEDALKAGHIDAAAEPPHLHGTLLTQNAPQPIPTLPGRWRNFYEQTAAALIPPTQPPPITPPPPVTLPQMRRLIATLDAIHDSARTNTTVKPPA